MEKIILTDKEAAQRCVDLYKEHFGKTSSEVTPITGSGSNRRYYRLKGCDGSAGGDSVIAVAGTCLEENNAFVSFSKLMHDAGVNVPVVLRVSDDGMTYLQSDCGDVSLHSFMQSHRLSDGSLDDEAMAMLRLTISTLPDIQFAPSVLVGKGELQDENELFDCCYQQKNFDRVGVMFDLNYFKYDYLKLIGIEFDELRLQHDFECLADDLLGNVGNTFLYRDFQSRNVLLHNSRPCFIDYQGGRRGPIYYDVASFLWQSSARFTDETRNQLIDTYLESLKKYMEIDRGAFMSRLRLFVLFRILQVLGAYGFRGLWEKKKYFIDSIPFALDNLKKEIDRGTCDKYSYLREVCEMLVACEEEKPKKNEKKEGEIMSSGDSISAAVHNRIANDTSYLNDNPDSPLVVSVYSFAFKKGIPVDESGNGGGYVFDCRSTHNPGRFEEYKPLTGLDKPVIDFLEEDGEILSFLDTVYKLVDFHVARFKARGFTNMQISFGCTGGRHRSVYCAQHAAEHINKLFGVEVRLCHRERGISSVLPAQEKK